MTIITRRSIAAVASLLALHGCSIAPQLAPSAAGCYAVQLDSVPAHFGANLVPPLPALVRLDTAFGGQVQVPRAWLESQGIGMRFAYLELRRPSLQIADNRVVAYRGRPTPLPSDSLVLQFGGGGATLHAYLAAESSGDWRGSAFVLSGETPRGVPLVAMRLQRSACGPTPMALSRQG